MCVYSRDPFDYASTAFDLTSDKSTVLHSWPKVKCVYPRAFGEIPFIQLSKQEVHEAHGNINDRLHEQ